MSEPDKNWYDRAELRPVTFRRGDRGDGVEKLQGALRAVDSSLAPDGIYGPAVERAVRKLQRAHDLVADGIAGPKVFSALEDMDLTRLLGQSDIARAAKRLGVSEAAVMAVNEVESRGSGFLDDGQPVILFERHWMYRLLKTAGTNPDPWQRKLPGIVNASPGGYRGGAAEHQRLKKAKGIEPGAAVQSASWGLFQIMGFHYALLEYPTPADMEQAARRSEGDQLDMFVAFIEADPAMHRALRDGDWAGFAESYNGPEYAKHNYHGRMADAYARHQDSEEVA